MVERGPRGVARPFVVAAAAARRVRGDEAELADEPQAAAPQVR